MSSDLEKWVIKFEVKGTDELCANIGRVRKELASLREELALWLDNIEVVDSE